MRRTLAVAAVVTAALTSATSAADDPLLKKLTGTFVGQGKFWWDSTSGPVGLYCTMTNALGPDGGFHETGRCAVGDDSAAIRMDIQLEKAGVYSGSASTGLGLRKPVLFGGTGKGNQLVLTYPAGPDDLGPTVVTLEAVSGGFRVHAERTDNKTGKKFVATDATFGPP